MIELIENSVESVKTEVESEYSELLPDFVLHSKKDPFQQMVQVLLACTICKQMCSRGVSVKCCGAQACRGCAFKQATSSRKCWFCSSTLKSIDLENDDLLRSAISEFKEKKTICQKILIQLEGRHAAFISLAPHYTSVMKSAQQKINEIYESVEEEEKDNMDRLCASEDELSVLYVNTKLYKKSRKTVSLSGEENDVEVSEIPVHDQRGEELKKSNSYKEILEILFKDQGKKPEYLDDVWAPFDTNVVTVSLDGVTGTGTHPISLEQAEELAAKNLLKKLELTKNKKSLEDNAPVVQTQNHSESKSKDDKSLEDNKEEDVNENEKVNENVNEIEIEFEKEKKKMEEVEILSEPLDGLIENGPLKLKARAYLNEQFIFQSEALQPVIFKFLNVDPEIRYIRYFANGMFFRCAGEAELFRLFHSREALAVLKIIPIRKTSFYFPTQRVLSMERGTKIDRISLNVTHKLDHVPKSAENETSAESPEFRIVVRLQKETVNIKEVTSLLGELVLLQEEEERVKLVTPASVSERQNSAYNITYSHHDVLVCKLYFESNRQYNLKLLHSLVYSENDHVRLIVFPYHHGKTTIRNGQIIATATRLTSLKDMNVIKNYYHIPAHLFKTRGKGIPKSSMRRAEEKLANVDTADYSSQDDDNDVVCLDDQDSSRHTSPPFSRSEEGEEREHERLRVSHQRDVSAWPGDDNGAGGSYSGGERFQRPATSGHHRRDFADLRHRLQAFSALRRPAENHRDDTHADVGRRRQHATEKEDFEEFLSFRYFNSVGSNSHRRDADGGSHFGS